MKKKYYISTFIIICLCVFLGVKFHKQTTTTSPNPIWVQTALVVETTLPMKAHALGTLTAPSVIITPEVAGHVKKIYFKDGATVEKGDLLIQLDDDYYKAAYDAANAQLTFSENKYKRLQQLEKKGVIAKQTIDQALSEYKEKLAVLKTSSVMLDKMRLIAPFDGIMGKSQISPGDYVTIGENLTTITDNKHVRVEYTVPEKYISYLKKGQRVNITTSAYPNKIFSGKLNFIAPTINTDNRSISLYADINQDEASNLLLSGMFVNVTHYLDSNENVLLIPARALVPILDGEQVYRVVDKKTFSTSIILGKRIKDSVQVVEGLKKGDKVVTDGQNKIKDGSIVNIKS